MNVTTPELSSVTPKRKSVLVIGGALLILALFFLLRGRGDRAVEGALAEPPPPAPAVIAPILIARPTAIRGHVEVTGTVRSAMSTPLSSKIMGRVAAIAVDEGDRFRAGQVLVRLESADLQAGVRQAEAAVAAARQAQRQAVTGGGIQRTRSATQVEQANASLRAARSGLTAAQSSLAQAREQLSLVREGARSQQKLQADAAVRQAEAAYRTAQATYDRYKPLFDEGVIPRQRLDEVALQRDVAQSQHETARQQASLVHEGARLQETRQAEEDVRKAEEGVRQAREGIRQAEEGVKMARAATAENRIKADNVRMLEAQVDQARAALASARVTLSYAAIRAPFNGIVVKRHADPGAMASPGVPLLTLDDASGFHLEALVPESRLSEIRIGRAVELTIDALGRTFDGRITGVVPSTDTGSRTFVVKASLPRAPGLSDGLFGRMRLAQESSPRLLIPRTALWRKESLVGVLVVEDGIAHRRLVTLGEEQGDRVEILSGLKGGESIVERGAEKIADGARVREEGDASIREEGDARTRGEGALR